MTAFSASNRPVALIPVAEKLDAALRPTEAFLASTAEPEPLAAEETDLSASATEPSVAPSEALDGDNFFTSKDSETGKARWIVRLVMFALSALFSFAATVAPAVGIVLLVLVLGSWAWMESVLAKDVDSSLPSITLSDEGICSRLFQGKEKVVLWGDIESISIAQANGLVLFIQLAEHAITPTFFKFLAKRRVQLRLSPLSAPEIERLTVAVQLRLPGVEIGKAEAEQEQDELNAAMRKDFPIPWSTYTLIVLNLAIWSAMLFLGAQSGKVSTLLLHAWGGNTAYSVQNGEPWRLLTSAFVHGSLTHVGMNMVGLWAVGSVVERLFGRSQFLMIYIVSAVAGSVASLFFSAQTHVSVGASGAVFGLCGAALVGALQHRRDFPSASRAAMLNMVVFLLYSLAQGLNSPEIDNSAHIGGLFGGAFIAALVAARFSEGRFLRASAKKTQIAGIAGVILLSVAATFAPTSTFDVQKIDADNKRLSKALEDFIEMSKSIEQEQVDILSGKISKKEADDRSRSVFGPRARSILNDLNAVALHEKDPRQPLLNALRKAVAIATEQLEMDSIFNEETDEAIPVDKDRWDVLSQQGKEVAEEIKKIMDEIKAASEKNKRKP